MTATDDALSVTVDAAGLATARIQTGSKFQTWTVSQVSVEMPSAPIGSTCWLRKNGAPITPLIATGDAASGDPPIILRPGETMTVEFAGCTPGDVGNIFLVYDDGLSAS
jgi:hypothetical protein